MTPQRWARLRENIAVVLVALASVFIFQTAVAQATVVEGSSMEPTLHSGDRLVVAKFLLFFRRPQAGDIVVFQPPHDSERIFIKRLIARAGQTVEFRSGTVLVDGRPLQENYARHDYFTHPRITVPPGMVYVLGDNRPSSNDSRYPSVGFVPEKNIRGIAVWRFFPFDQMAFLGNDGPPATAVTATRR